MTAILNILMESPIISIVVLAVIGCIIYNLNDSMVTFYIACAMWFICIVLIILMIGEAPDNSPVVNIMTLVASHPVASFIGLVFAGLVVYSWSDSNIAFCIACALWFLSIFPLGAAISCGLQYMSYAAGEAQSISIGISNEFTGGLQELKTALNSFVF